MNCSSHSRMLKLSIATVLLGTASIAVAQSPSAASSDDDLLGEIVVTGTSLRGVPPVGSNLIEIGRDDVVATGATTVQDLLATVPQFATFNRSPAPAFGSAGNISTGPSLRGIGIAQTISLVNGHRLVGTGHLQNNPDPSIIPPSAVERVEIIADGASAIYGSDAVSGVVNVITRKNFNGAETTLRYGDTAYSHNLNASQLIGRAWGSGSVLATVEYSTTGRLNASDFDGFNSDRRSVGGVDARVRNCADANVSIGTTNYAYPALTPGSVNLCDNAKRADLVPRERRLSAFVTGRQEFGEDVEMFADVMYSRGRTNYLTSVGAPAPFTMTNANPFFIAPPGTNATSATVSMDLTKLLGPTFSNDQGIEIYGGTLGADIALPADFSLNIYGSGGRSKSYIDTPSFNPATIVAAAAGTTTATALDPFTGRTSQAVINELKNFQASFGSEQELYELNAKVDGALFTLPAGEVKLAVGVDFRRETYDGFQNTGRYNAADSLGTAEATRRVKSLYGELFVPILGAVQSIPGIEGFDISLSGRYDDYSDFGDTTNPKYGFNWSPIEAIKIRGSYGTSYHAPALPDLSGPDTRAQFVPNAPIGPPGTGALNTFILAGSNPNLQPETATTRSIGVDIIPRDALPGFQSSLTYYTIDFKGLIDFPRGNLYLDPYYVQFAYYQPTPAEVEQLIAGMRVVGVSRPFPVIGNVLDLRRKNLGEVETDGLDLALGYRWSTSFMEMQVALAGNRVLNYDVKASPLSPPLDQFTRGLGDTSLRASWSGTTGTFQSNVAVNYSSDYQQQYVTTANATQLETVDSFTTVELHFSYELELAGVFEGTKLMLDVENLLDEEPPFTRSATAGLGLATGGGVGAGNPFGRMIAVGLQKKW